MDHDARNPYGAKPRRWAWTDFRSTLEADWACTLDGLGIAWEYEPQTIELPSGVRYIPDFWLPEIGTWIEVKGPDVPGADKARELGRTLACTCPPSPAPCTCQWEGGVIVLIGRVPARNELRHGSMVWSDAVATSMLTTCLLCDATFWLRTRASMRCRSCREWRPGSRHLHHLIGSGSTEAEFRRADRIAPEHQ